MAIVTVRTINVSDERNSRSHVFCWGSAILAAVREVEEIGLRGSSERILIAMIGDRRPCMNTDRMKTSFL